jgi:hypothetical protein
MLDEHDYLQLKTEIITNAKEVALKHFLERKSMIIEKLNKMK